MYLQLCWLALQLILNCFCSFSDLEQLVDTLTVQVQVKFKFIDYGYVRWKTVTPALKQPIWKGRALSSVSQAWIVLRNICNCGCVCAHTQTHTWVCLYVMKRGSFSLSVDSRLKPDVLLFIRAAQYCWFIIVTISLSAVSVSLKTV